MLRADLRGASLKEADLRFAILTQADLSGADLIQADLRWAHLEQADLHGTYLWESNLHHARVGDGTSLGGAFLGQPDAGKIEAIDIQTVQSKLLGSATMPDGRKYEDWIKDDEGSGEAGESSGPS